MWELYIWRTLFVVTLILLAARWVRQRKGTPRIDDTPKLDDPPTVAVPARRATCTLPNKTIETSCTNGWWEHWWDGIQYCEDGKRTCELYGGKWTVNEK